IPDSARAWRGDRIRNSDRTRRRRGRFGDGEACGPNTRATAHRPDVQAAATPGLVQARQAFANASRHSNALRVRKWACALNSRGKIIEKVPESPAGSDCEITSCAAGASPAQRGRDGGGCSCAEARRSNFGAWQENSAKFPAI